jgi:hypothetical protein
MDNDKEIVKDVLIGFINKFDNEEIDYFIYLLICGASEQVVPNRLNEMIYTVDRLNDLVKLKNKLQNKEKI